MVANATGLDASRATHTPDVGGGDVVNKYRDRTRPDGPWVFDAEVTRVFDDMLARSIPNLTTMRNAVVELATRRVFAPGAVVDLGVSRGGMLAPIMAALDGKPIHYVGVDLSPEMVTAAAAVLPLEAEIRVHDLRRGLPYVGMGLRMTLAVLTLQFVPIEFRQRIITEAYNATIPGGVFILVEKLVGSSALIQDLQVEIYHGHKQANGYTVDDIEAKRLSLENTMVPLTEAANVAMLRSAGFTDVECFWRWFNFAGFVAVKR